MIDNIGKIDLVVFQCRTLKKLGPKDEDFFFFKNQLLNVCRHFV